MSKKASKPVTIASLVRTAAKSETDFIQVVDQVFATESEERQAEFFDRLNIPRSQGAENLLAPLPSFAPPAFVVSDFDNEARFSAGVQKYMDRHERKIKWHASHPSLEGVENVLLLFRAAIMTTNMRLKRLENLLNSTDELSATDWSIARELMNRSYLSFRNFLELLGSSWIDSVQTAVPRDELTEKIGNFYEFIDTEVRQLEEARTRIEERRAQLTVIPLIDTYPPVKPPQYFGGDLMGRGPWKQFWTNIDERAHHFRESLG